VVHRGRPHVLHVLAPGPYGGLERVVRDLAIAQRESGRAVAVAAIASVTRAAEAFLAPLCAHDIQVHTVIVPARAYHQERRTFRALLQETAPAVVHTHGYRADVVDGVTAARMGIPTVSTVHGFTGGGLRNRLYEALQVRSYRRIRAVVAVAESVARRLRASGVDPASLHVVRNAWRPSDPPLPRDRARAMLGIEGTVPVIGWVGRLSPEKGARWLLEADSHLDIPHRVVIIGDGPESSDLRLRAAELGITDRVHWLGAVPDAARLFPAFDVFVLSSLTEGTPMVLFEAMSCEVPIVATHVGGVPDVLGPESAILVRPADPKALADAIRSTLEDPIAYTSRARAAKSRLSTAFNPDAWVAAYDAVYDAARNGAIQRTPRPQPTAAHATAERRA